MIGYGNPELWDFAATLAGGAAALIVLFAVRGA